MKCPKCQHENPDTQKFCGECGSKLERICPNCSANNPSGYKFCGECGSDLRQSIETPLGDDVDQESPSPESTIREIPPAPKVIEGERKYVTALFSDMSGYTAMSERLDPEEVKEITSRIFGEVSKTVKKYDGFVEKFIGDAVMALFGVPKAHEDDPVRAIKAAKEIHDLIKAVSPELEEKIGKPLTMHTGINTGLVVTGEVDMEKGTHGVSGDTINVAARLSGLAEADQIIVGPDTYHQAEGYFVFEALEPAKVKGKADPIRIHKVLSRKEQPSTTHRRHGLRADLIGREVELAQLREAAEKLQEGKGAIFSICGETGIGKTRLVEAFKETLDLNEIQWLDGQAYAYAQNIPYFPVIDLFSRGFQIKEGDTPEKVRKKIESGVRSLVGKREDVIPYVGSLYTLSYPEIEEVSPEFWKSRIQEAIHAILSGLAQRVPTIICLEDLHWADPSSIDLLRFVLSEFRHPALFICVYRPTISLFTSHQLSGLKAQYQEIQLQDLSLSEAQNMLASLLKAKEIPKDLWRFIQDNVGGNPFYLEEVINALVEAETLTCTNGTWNLDRPINQIDMPSTIHGIIAARLDHLESESKRILQEASVIGRTFLYDLLKNCTNLKEHLDRNLTGLERLDLIHARTLQPDLEYVFKSALTQEVVYSGLLKKERLKIHERIGRVIEQLFADRLPEFYETLAFHYKQSNSVIKAVDYLMKAAEKSLKRYSVQESHAYYKDAYQLMMDNPTHRKDNQDLFYDLLNKWSLVYYYRGEFKEQTDLLKSHESEADLIQSVEIRGMFYGWLGFNLSFRKETEDSYRYLQKALKIGKETKNQRVIGYAYTWLTWLCAVMDRYDEAYSYWENAVEIAKSIGSDQYLYFKAMGSIGQIAIFCGGNAHSYDAGKEIVDYGKKHSNIRSQVVGHVCIGHSHYSDGNYKEALISYSKALEVAVDPFYTEWARLYVGIVSFIIGELERAEEALTDVAFYIENFGCEIMSSATFPMLGAILISKGEMSKGLELIKKTYRSDQEKKWGYGIGMAEYTLAKIYAQLSQVEEKPTFSFLAKNFKFIVQNIPFAFKKSEKYFTKAIETAKTYKAQGILGLAYYNLGDLYLTKKKQSQAKECFLLAVDVFKQLGSKIHLKNAQEALKSLE